MEKQNNSHIVLWRPSGGLGHCLHNLAWTLEHCLRNNYIMYIYGLHIHDPFQYHVSDFLELLKKYKVTELKNEKELDDFCKKYNVSNDGIKLIHNCNCKTGVKFINANKNCSLVCSAWGHKISKCFNFKKEFIQNILDNPYKYYKNDYNLLFHCEINKKTFHIKGSYMKALGIFNKNLGITSDDIDYLNLKKKLCINYTKTDKTKHYIECLEYTTHSIDDIYTLDKAVYGVKDKTIDVTSKIINQLYDTGKEYELEVYGSYLKKFQITNENLNITPEDPEYKIQKTLSLKYEQENNDIKEVFYKENTDFKIDNIKNIISARYGVNNKQSDITNKVKSLCRSKNNKLELSDIDKQKSQINDILINNNYIAVHFRFRDKKVSGGYKKKLSEINEAINKSKIRNIFVATDSPMFFDYLYNNLNDVVIFRYTNPPSHGLNIHYNNDVFTKGENFYKSILDLYICKRAAYFIPSIGSGFSIVVRECNFI